MKKNYQELQINVISLDDADVIATSGAKKGNTYLEDQFDLGGMGIQQF